jgi:hypothetical protein
MTRNSNGDEYLIDLAVAVDDLMIQADGKSEFMN